uniref:WD_REPEATS_REGION domain-containing protein n=1 Tax=Parastrongyloides trichosuri TaxID=131310 RepID=A0A0N5A7F7_PARTI
MKKGDKNERLLLNEIDNNGADRKLIDQSIFTANQIQSIVNEIENYTNGITVYEELYKKHIRINTSYKDEIDGSQYIKIKDLSKIISPEHADFFKNMKNIKLRKDFRSYHVWPLEYKLINTPLIEDFCKKQLNIKKYDEGFKICFHDIKNSGQLTSSNSSNEIVILSLMDKMKTFSMLHKEVARFSHYYYNYYNKYCNIKLYSYHKLIIAYGKERDQLMFLTYKPSKDSFLLSFGQDLKRTFVCGDEIEYKPSKNPSLWNAHNFVSSFLTDKCNKEYFLTDLVSYLIETNQPLQLLYSVIKEKVNCLSGFSQILVGENVYSEEFDLQIIANNERSFKIICAHMIMELFLSNDNYIYIKDCSKDEPKLYGLKKLFSSKETSNTQKVMDRDKDNEVRIEKGARSLPPVNITEAEETFKNPLSVPSSINISLNEQNTSMTTEDITGMSEENRKEYFSASRNIIRITHNDLETLLYHDTTSTSVSKLQNYLYSLRTFERLTTILVHNYGKPIPGAGGLTVHYVNISHLMVKISFASVKQLDGRIPCDINFTLYIEPYTFKIRLNLEYVGVLKPSNEEIKVAEEYFEDVLCYTDSPQKVYSFMNLIRMIFPKSFSCFTNLMILERNPDPSHFYRMNFDFVNVTKKLDDQMRKYTPKILVNEHSDRLLIPIFILPQKNESKKSDLCNRINLDFVWDAAKNEVYIHNISNEFMKMINQKVIQYNNTIKDSLECTIEACIRYILNSEINP